MVIGFAFLLGLRSGAGPLEWLAAVGVLVLLALGLSWLTVGLGLAADSVETASNTPLFLILLPFVSSGFVPTVAMPAGLRQVAEYQPFTPFIGTIQTLATGADTGEDVWAALGWRVAIALAGYLWSRRPFLRVPSK